MVEEIHRRAGGAVVASGWLGASAGFGYQERRLGRAFATSLVIHGALLAILILVFAAGPAREVINQVAPLI